MFGTGTTLLWRGNWHNTGMVMVQYCRGSDTILAQYMCDTGAMLVRYSHCTDLTLYRFRNDKLVECSLGYVTCLILWLR